MKESALVTPIDWLKCVYAESHWWLCKLNGNFTRWKKGKSTLKSKPLLFALVTREKVVGGHPGPIQLFILCYYASGKKGFFVAEKKDGVRSRIYIFMNNSFDKKNSRKRGKNGVYMQRVPTKTQLLWFFFRTHPIIQRCPAGRLCRFPDSNEN